MKGIKHPSNNFSGIKGRRGRKGQKGEKGDAGTNIKTFCRVKLSIICQSTYNSSTVCACEVPA